MGKIIVMYVEGGPRVGLGHASRGLGLAHAFRKKEHTPSFLIAPDSGLRPFLEDHGYEAMDCPREELIEAYQNLDADCLVIDSYQFDSSFLAQLSHQGIPLACFDDTAKRELPVDIVINASPAAETLPYRTRPETKRLFGLSYQVIRPEFLKEVPRDYSNPRSLLVTMGGDDLVGISKDLLSFLINNISSTNSGLEVHFIVGPYFKGLQEDDFANTLPSSIHIHHSPKDMRSLMVKADMAISAGGQTLYELARCGTPTIAFCVGEDQEPNLKALAHIGVIDFIGWARLEGWLGRLERSLKRLWNDRSLREELGRCASTLIDGRGAFRISKTIETLLESDHAR